MALADIHRGGALLWRRPSRVGDALRRRQRLEVRRTGTWKAANEERDEKRQRQRAREGEVATTMGSMVDELVAVAWQQPHVNRVSSHTKAVTHNARGGSLSDVGPGLVRARFRAHHVYQAYSGHCGRGEDRVRLSGRNKGCRF